MLKRVNGLLTTLFLIAALSIAGCTTSEKHGPLELGNEFAKDNMWREASESYQEYLNKVNPDDPVAHHNLGLVLIRMGSYKKAVLHLEKSLSQYEDDFETNFQLGEAYRGQDMFAEAIYRYQKSLKIKPNEVRAMKALSWSYFRIRFFSESMALLDKLRKVTPKDSQVPVIQARTLLAMNKPTEALEVLQLGRDIADEKSIPYLNSVEGDIRFEIGDTKGAAKSYRLALKGDPMLAGALLGLGKLAVASKDFDKAVDFLERAIRVKPRLAEAHYFMAKALEPSNKTKALQYFKSFYRLASKDSAFSTRIAEVKKRFATASPEGSNPSP